MPVAMHRDHQLHTWHGSPAAFWQVMAHYWRQAYCSSCDEHTKVKCRKARPYLVALPAHLHSTADPDCTASSRWQTVHAPLHGLMTSGHQGFFPIEEPAAQGRWRLESLQSLGWSHLGAGCQGMPLGWMTRPAGEMATPVGPFATRHGA